LITATSLLTSTMTQSAITIGWQPINSTDDQQAWVATGPNPLYVGNEVMSTSAMHAIQLGILTPPEEQVDPLNAICGTGHCDFPTVKTLGVCAQTSNVTSHLSFADSTVTSYAELKDFVRMEPLEVFEGMGPGVLSQPIRNASLPTGPYLVGAKHLFSLNMSTPSHLTPDLRWNPTWMPQNATLSFGNSDLLGSAISNFFVIWLNQGYFYPNGTNSSTMPAVNPPSRENVDQAFRATEVLLHYCVQTYNVTVREGHTTTVLVDNKTFVESIDTTTQRGGEVDGSVTLRPSANITANDTANDILPFRAMADTFSIFDRHFRPLFAGTFCFDYYRGSGNCVRGLTPGSEAVGHAFWTRTLKREPLSSQGPTISELDDLAGKAIENMSRNVADSLTNR